MSALSIVIITVAVFAAALLVTSGIIFYTSFARRPLREFDPSKSKKWSDPILAGAADRIALCSDRLQSMELERVYITSADGLCLCAHLYEPENMKALVILAHGYRGSYYSNFGCVFDFFASRGYGMLFIEQRAHGESEGKYICFGVKERDDIKRWAYLMYDRFGSSVPIVLQGVSMGSSSVLMATGEDLPPTVKCVVADCGFTSPADEIGYIADKSSHFLKMLLLPFIDIYARLIAGFSLYGYSTLTALRTNRLPVIFCHGTADKFVPCYMTEQNYEACIAPKEVVYVEGASHALSYIVETERCEKALGDFLDRYV